MKLRLKPYPEYKDSGVAWLGKVPSRWDVNPGLAAFREKQVKNTGMREKTVLSLSFGRIVVKPPEKLHGLVPESFETYQIVEPGDIIIRSTDLQNDWNSLRVGLVKNRGIITSAYICLKMTGQVSADYGFHLLHTYDLKKIFYGMGSGLRQNLAWTDFKRMPILVPPSEEQSAIARFLEHTDVRINRLIRAKRRLIELLNEQKQAIIHRAVTGKDEVRMMKDENGDSAFSLQPSALPKKPSGISWLGDIPKHWELWQIGHIARIGNGSTPSRGNAAYWKNGTYPWLNSSSVNRNPIASANQFVTSLALEECHLPRVPAGSVLIAITGQGKTRGTAAVLSIEATINQHMAYITPRPKLTSANFLQLFLTAAYRELRRISDDSGSTKGALTCSEVSHFNVTLPPVAEQAEIIAAVQKETQKLEAAIARASREIDLIREYRTRLIADVVTGQLDVRGAVQSLPKELSAEPFEDETDISPDELGEGGEEAALAAENPESNNEHSPAI